jgi:peptide/nickel transport system substrate-binding protein
VANATATAGGASVKSGGKIVVGMNAEPDSMDQHVASSRYNEFINQNIYDRLIEMSNDMTFHPGLADKWEVSTDGLTWTLMLHQGVTFHDGTPFSADTVKHNFDRIVDPATKSQKAVGLLGPYASTEAIDESTAKITLSDAYAPFIHSLASLYLVMESPAAIEKWGQDYGQHPVGTGPFMFKEWVQKDHLTIIRNPDYNWAPKTFGHQGPAYLEEIRYQFIPESATRNTSLENGETDVVINVAPQDFDRFHSDTKSYGTIVSPVLGQPPGIIINTERPPTDDINVRQAIAHGVDQKGLIETVFYDVFERAYGPLTQYNQFYDKQMEAFYTFDQEKSKSLLDAAGWKTGSKGIREKDGKPLQLVYIAFPGGTSITTAEFIQGQLRDIGIDVQINQLNNPANITASQAGEHHLRWLNWLFSDAAELATTFHSKNIGSGWNFARWKNDELDSLFDQGKTELDTAKRATTYAQVQKIIMDNTLLVPLYVGSQVIAHQAKVQGIRMHPLGDNAMFYDTHID